MENASNIYGEMTRYAFISHMEDYIKQLLKNPLTARVDEFLLAHEIDEKKALAMLLKRTDPSDMESAVLVRTERIRPEEQSEEDIAQGITPKDKFYIRYKLPRKDYKKKMRNLYISMFEKNIIENSDTLNEWYYGGKVFKSDKKAKEIMARNKKINECDGGAMAGMGGATTCDASSGQYVQPLTKKPIRRCIITQEQYDHIKKVLSEEAEMDTMFGDFGYDAPPFAKKKDPAYDHKNMMAKSWRGNA